MPRSVRTIEHLDDFKRELNRNSPKRYELYYFGERKIAIIDSRMRMGCIQLNRDLYKIGVVESPACSCGANQESIYHFFFECDKYVTLRNELQCKVLTLGNFNLKTLLFGIERRGFSKSQNEEIFEGIHKYKKLSGRFKT